MSLFGEEYLNHTILRNEIEGIQKLVDNQPFDTIVRSSICRKSDLITVPIPNRIDKMYYVLCHLAKADNAFADISTGMQHLLSNCLQ